MPTLRPRPRPSVLVGAGLIWEGLRLLLGSTRLWPLAVAPAALATALVGTASALVLDEGSKIRGLLTNALGGGPDGWSPTLVAAQWWEWAWIGPARAGVVVLGWLLFLLSLAAAALLAYLMATVIAAPLLDLLSRRIEAMETGAVLEDSRRGLSALWSNGWVAVRAELRRTLTFVGLWLTVATLGILIPGAQLVAGPALVLLTMLFLPLEYGAYVLDRRLVPFAGRRHWIRDNLSAALGFGAMAFITLLVPGLNFLMLPVLVSAGTLFAVRYGPAGPLRNANDSATSPG